MKRSALLLLLGLFPSVWAQNARLLHPSLDAGGRSSSTDYILDSSLGSFGGAVLGNAEVSIRLGFSGQLNDAPVLQPQMLARAGVQSVKALQSSALLGAVDLEGDPFAFLDVDPLSANGKAVSVSEGWIFYESNLASPDAITYRVMDAYGSVSAGNIVITSGGPGASQTFLRVEILAGGTIRRVLFVGIPGRSYTIQASATLESPAWAPIGVSVAGANGLYTFDDANGPAARFYRAVQQ